MAFKDLTEEDKLIAVHTDMMRHSEFSILGGVTQVGKVTVDDTTPTAKTNGADVYYGRAFIAPMTRAQLRYLVAHENLHKALHHCTEYVDIAKKYPKLFPQAADYVVNGTIESMDPTFAFVARPTQIPPLVDAKYADMGVLEVLRDLIKNPPPPQDKEMDEHEEGAEAQAQEGQGPTVQQQISDAVRQGKILSDQLKSMRGEGAGSSSLTGFVERKTDWRTPLRRFVQEVCEGDEQSRFSPPNKRMLPLGIILPSHFSESMDELLIACDTSGSMHGVYPLVFGEIANICQSVSPKRVRMLWWDTKVASEQVFTPKDYDKIRYLVKPEGGGGTTVSCVAKYVAAKGYKPKATIMLTDGHIESQYDVVPGSILWGIVGNPRFVARRGRVLHMEDL